MKLEQRRERALHTAVGVSKAGITYKRLGFKLLVEPVHEASVCLCWWLIFSCQVRIRSHVLSASTRSPQPHPDGLTQVGAQRGKTDPNEEKNTIITRLKAKNTACSVHHLIVAGSCEEKRVQTREKLRRTGLKDECVDAGRRGQRVGHKLKLER